ncbi:ABC transporter permease, partial [Streptacidiphilus pinicola]
MSALGKVVRAGVGRRRVQTAVTGLAAMMAVTASVLGGSLLVAADAPFEHAFARQNGAHLAVSYDGAKVDAAELTASAHGHGVSASAGPFETATVDPSGVTGLDLPAGMSMSPMTLVGRTDSRGAVDDLSLTSGHWLTGPGQLVVSADYDGPQLSVGQRVHVPDGRGGSRELTVVGVARSVDATADGWAEPSDVAAVAAHGVGYQMLYRFDSAATAAQLAADRAAVTDGLPAGAVSGARTWLDVRDAQASSTGLFLPFLTAFGLLGLAMSVLIVGNVVAGAVGSGTRRIGVLKAIGFTPAQVVRAYLAQALVPAGVGTLLGVLVGDLIATQVLSATEEIYGSSTLAVAPSVDLAVAGGTLLLVALTALVTALRAGRLRTVDALSVGRTAGGGRGRRAARLARALPLPRPVTLGLARPFARPVRALSLVVAVLFGATAVTFAYGLSSSLQRVQDSKSVAADVSVLTSTPPQAAPPGGSAHHGAADPAAVAAAIRAQSGTASFFGAAHTQVTAAGTTGAVAVTAYVGDASGSGSQLVSGRW